MTDFLDAAREAQAGQRLALHRALTGQSQPAEGDTQEPPRPAGFDGGAREDASWPTQPTMTHGEFLTAAIQKGRGAGDDGTWS